MSREQSTGIAGEPLWFKSSHSGSGGGDCVEVATSQDAVCVRDTKAEGNGPVLRIARGGWAAFVTFARL